jgi:hypothetical protein
VNVLIRSGAVPRQNTAPAFWIQKPLSSGLKRATQLEQWQMFKTPWVSFRTIVRLRSAISLIFLLAAAALGFTDEVPQPEGGGKGDAAFLESLASNDDGKSSQAILVARSQGTPSSAVALRLVEIVGSGRSDYLRALAASAVGELCPASESDSIAKSAVQWLRTDLSPWVREGAAISLGHLKQDDEETVSALIEGTKDVAPSVRFSSYMSLGEKQQNAERILQALEKGIRDRSGARYAISQSFYSVRAVAIGAITSLGLRGKIAESSLSQLMLLLRDENEEVGVAACIAAARISDDPMVHSEIESALLLFLDVDEDSPFEVITCREALKCLAILKAPERSWTRTTSVQKVLRLLQNRELQIYDPDFTIAIAGAIKHFGKGAANCLPSLRSLRTEIDSAEATMAIEEAIDTIEKGLAEESAPPNASTFLRCDTDLLTIDGEDDSPLIQILESLEEGRIEYVMHRLGNSRTIIVPKTQHPKAAAIVQEVGQ